MILSEEFTVPIIFQLFERNPLDRLGMPTCPAGSINSQPFFRGIDWEKLEARQISPPFKPKIVSFFKFVQPAFKSFAANYNFAFLTLF